MDYDYHTFADSTYKFLDPTGGVKPYLLNERNNHAGTRTLVEYAASARFYVEDERLPSTRWQGRLPFPCKLSHALKSSISCRAVSSPPNTSITRVLGWRRAEFRGFGMVEQFDTETFARYHSQGLHGQQNFNTVDAPTSRRRRSPYLVSPGPSSGQSGHLG
jgi:hypothetical protein